MNYQTFEPHADLGTIVKCYWTLEVPYQPGTAKQLILPDGCVDICFILGDDIKRYTSDSEYIIQPRNMLLGQITEQFFVEPVGEVNTFAVRFYPYGFANIIDLPLNTLANKETPLAQLFGEGIADSLGQEILQARHTAERIVIMEKFLMDRLYSTGTISQIVKSTIEAMVESQGTKSVNEILQDDLSKRRQLERNFVKQIGLSPKQLSKVIRLQATLQMLLDDTNKSLTELAYEHDYYDQAHFTKDFKEFTGIAPKDFLTDEQMRLSSLLYRKS